MKVSAVIKKSEDYRKLRSLWAKTFGDAPSDVDEFYENFAKDVDGYILRDDDQEVASALTLFRMGDLAVPNEAGIQQGQSIPAYVSYAICTDASARGKGYGSHITEYAREVVTSSGGVALLSPAEPSLVQFYQPLEYKPVFVAIEHEIKRDTATASLTNYTKLTYEEYNSLREDLLKDVAHIKLNDATLRYLELGSKGLYSALDGKVIIATEMGTNRFAEVIADLSLEPCEVDAAVSELAGALGLKNVVYRTPVGPQYGSKGKEYIQAMIAGERNWNFDNGYFGLTFD